MPSGQCSLRAARTLPALDVLAAAYAEAGRYGEAVETAEKALDLAHEQKKPSAAEAHLFPPKALPGGGPISPDAATANRPELAVGHGK